MSETNFAPFVARAVMATALSVKQPIPLEGILYDVCFRRDQSTFGKKMPFIGYRDGIPMMSQGVIIEEGIAGIGHSSLTTVKSVDFKEPGIFEVGIDIPDAKAWKIDAMSTYRGQLRKYDLLTNVREIVFQGYGDPDVVRQHLGDVLGLGAQRHRGIGVIEDWIVEESTADTDNVGWFSADGKLLRRLPRDTIVDRLGAVPDNAAVEHGPLHTPYWDVQEHLEIGIPLLRGMTAKREDAWNMLAY